MINTIGNSPDGYPNLTWTNSITGNLAPVTLVYMIGGLALIEWIA